MKQPTTTTTPILMFKAEPDPNRERMIKEWSAREKAGTTTVTTPTTPTPSPTCSTPTTTTPPTRPP